MNLNIPAPAHAPAGDYLPVWYDPQGFLVIRCPGSDDSDGRAVNVVDLLTGSTYRVWEGFLEGYVEEDAEVRSGLAVAARYFREHPDAPKPADLSPLQLGSPLVPLTRREVQSARLLGRGYTIRRVADALTISPRTAEIHAREIRGKYGVRTRDELIDVLLPYLD